MLRTGPDQIGVSKAILKRLLTTDTWSPDQMEALNGNGIPFEGRWPEGSPWKDRRVPLLVVVNEGNMGAGVKTAVDLKDGELVALYMGTEATEIGVEEFPPNRRTTYATRNTGLQNQRGGPQPRDLGKTLKAGDERIHAVSDQPFNVLQEKNAVGPLLNASRTEAEANVVLNRRDCWRDKDGNLYIGMYAKSDVAAGNFLHWFYDFKAGRGGANSYSFPDD